MIPTFPEFKKLELSDKQDVESFTKDLPPYSDFNFVSMWSWDIKGDLRISELGGNLVVRFSDYQTEELFFSIIGTKDVPNSVRTLIENAKILGLKAELKLVPEETAKCITDADSGIIVEEDRDNFDYICDVNELKTYEGGKFKPKRQDVNGLLEAHPTVSHEEIDLADPEMRKDIMTLFDKWLENKKKDGKEFESHEISAFNRMLLIADKCELVCVGAFLGEELIAFILTEREEDGYVLGHASKTDNAIRGINSYIMKAMAETVAARGVRYFNYEQDLGFENLRDGKGRFRPAFFLKKYRIRLG